VSIALILFLLVLSDGSCPAVRKYFPGHGSILALFTHTFPWPVGNLARCRGNSVLAALKVVQTREY